MNYLPRLRLILVPLCASLFLACGSSTDTFVDDEDTGTPGDDTSTAGDGSGTDTNKADGPGSDTLGTDGSGSDTLGTDGSGTDTLGTDGSGTDTLTPPTDTSTCAGTVCGGVCVDTKTDPLNCGGCGKVVCHNEACQDGKPVCAAGLRPCGGAGACLGCKNLATDPANCGSCGTACTAGQLCSPTSGGGSSCRTGLTCPTGSTLCPGALGAPGACVNTDRDITNCGTCGKNCSPGEFCAGGTCTKYTSAPGCTTCPCVACIAPTDKCCRYTDGTVCSTKCPGG